MSFPSRALARELRKSSKRKNEMNKLNKNALYQSLQERSYFNVPFTLERSFLDEAVTAFFRFLEEPLEVKSQIDFSIAPIHRRGDVGFRLRNPDDHIYNDSKEFFHFHPALFNQYPEFLEKHPVVNDFVLKAKPIWEEAYQVVKNILEAFEPDFPELSKKVFHTETPHFLLRFLKYHWQNSGKYLAKPHFDAGSFTLAIAESGPGLRIGSGPDNLQLVEHKPGNAIFMLSSNFQKIMQGDQSNKLNAGWHDVIQLDETKIGKPFARWAVVAFIEAEGVEALPRTETHKWYKEETLDY